MRLKIVTTSNEHRKICNVNDKFESAIYGSNRDTDGDDNVDFKIYKFDT